MTTVGDLAFANCGELREADLPKAWTFGRQVFQDVNNDFTLKINSPDFPTVNDKVTFGTNAFYNRNTNTMTLYLGAGIRPAANGLEWCGFTWKEIKSYQ